MFFRISGARKGGAMGELDGTARRRLDGEVRRQRLDRRQVLKRIALAGGAAIAAPRAVESFVSKAAAASQASAGGNGGSNGGSNGVAGPTGPTKQTAVATGLGYPLGLFVVPGKKIYVADFGSGDGNANGQILSVNPSNGAVASLFSSGDYWPSDVAADSAGNIYFTDYGFDDDDASATNSQTTGVTEDGRVSVIPAGATSAQTLVTGLVDPSYLLLDEAHEKLYVSNTGETAGTGTADPSGVVLAYPLQVGGGSFALGTPTAVAGSGAAVTGPSSLPNQPVSSAVATNIDIFVAFGLALFGSDLYVSDEYAHVVYQVNLSAGTISTYAGDGVGGTSAGGDNGPATSASVPYPQGLAVDGLGNLYVLQIEGQVRRVDAVTEEITTIWSGGPYVSDNVGIKFDPSEGSLWYIQNSTPDFPTATLYHLTSQIARHNKGH
jgi:sugar lactone lactonase YvrE